MNEHVLTHAMVLMTNYSHRMAEGKAPLSEYEVMAYEQLCRAIESVMELQRIQMDASIDMWNREREKDDK